MRINVDAKFLNLQLSLPAFRLILEELRIESSSTQRKFNRYNQVPSFCAYHIYIVCMYILIHVRHTSGFGKYISREKSATMVSCLIWVGGKQFEFESITLLIL